MKKISIQFLIALFILAGINNLQARQTPAKPVKSTQTKKTVIKKKGKPAKKAGSVWVCDGTNGYWHHKRKGCPVLAKCKGKILQLPMQDAINTFRTKICKKCY